MILDVRWDSFRMGTPSLFG
jgi:hypothetical protein